MLSHAGILSEMKPILLSLLMFLVLGVGCTKVKVAMETCAAPSSKATPTLLSGPPATGGCDKDDYYGGDAHNFFNVETRQVIQNPGTHTCNTGIQKQCKSNAGSCGFGGRFPCINKFYPNSTGATSGQCDCRCS